MLVSDMEGRVAFITAAGAGIGRAIAVEWASRGGAVFVTDIDEALAEATAAEIRATGKRAAAMTLDVTDRAAIDTAVAAAATEWDGIDALFNVAGVNMPRNVEEMEDVDWVRLIDTNLSSVYRCSKQVIPYLRERGGGSIVNVASAAGILAENRCAAYTASKGGVVMLTRNMAMDFAASGIRVNAICPGSTRTPRIEGYWKSAAGGRREPPSPMARYAEPEEIARPAVFLASDDASYITGAVLAVDGGLTAGFRIAAFDEL